jgi:hypothetical protein
LVSTSVSTVIRSRFLDYTGVFMLLGRGRQPSAAGVEAMLVADGLARSGSVGELQS